MHTEKAGCFEKRGMRRIRLWAILLLSYVFVVLPSLVVFYITLGGFVSSYREDLIDFNMQFVDEFTLNIEYNLKEIMSAAQTIYTDNECIDILSQPIDKPELQKFYDNQAMKDHLLTLISRNFISGVYLYTADGQYYFANCNLGRYDIEKTLLTNEWLNSVKPCSNQFAFVGTHEPLQLTDGTPVFSLTKTLTDFSRNDIGLMLIDVRLDLFDNIYRSKEENSARTFLVADDSRNVIYGTDDSLIMDTLTSPDYDPVFENSAGYITFSEDGTTYLASYATSRLTDWKVISVLPMESVVDKANTVQHTLLLVILLTGIVAILCSAGFSLYISYPINRLTAQMKKVGSGNFEKIPYGRGSLETFLLTRGFNTMVERIGALLRNEYQLKLVKRDAEFKALQNQVNPHFLYNTLESISALADIEKIPAISDTCRTLANMFRYSVSTKKDTAPLRNEVRHLMDYIRIITLRFGDRIEFSLEMDPDLEDCVVLKLILQPLVENCVNHGLADRAEKGRVLIQIGKREDCLSITVRDNGKGIPQEKLEELQTMLQITPENPWEVWEDTSKSIGLRNIHLRLSSYYGRDFGIAAIESTVGEGTCITLTLPIEQNTRRPDNA